MLDDQGPVAILEHELLRCDLIYLARDAEGPCAFLLGARVRLPVGPERRQARYLGLSVARSDRGNDAVLEKFTADARDEETSRGVRLVLFTAAAARGVQFVKGTDFLLEGGQNTLRLAYSGVTADEIDEGIGRLAEALRSLPAPTA